MQKVKISQLGWVAAIAMAGVMIGSGFQGATQKIGVADLPKIVEGSDFYKQNEVTYNDFVAKRRTVLDFFNTYKVLTTEQTNRIQELSLKDNPTPQEKAELDRIKQDVVAQDKRSKELTIKPSPTPEEVTVLQDFAHRTQAMGQTFDQLQQTYQGDIQQKRDQIQQAAADKARDAIRQVGKDQAFTVIMSSAAAPYAANDVTDAAIKAMNAAK
jgi:Skp family chaperone for outer membrane proteins